MRNRVLSWLEYISISIIVQCFMIVQMCNVRGSVEIGGEYLILPALIITRVALEDIFEEER